MLITKQGKFFRIQFKYSPFLVEKVKELPGRGFDPTNKCWVVPEVHEAVVRSFGQRYNFQFGIDIEDEQIGELPEMPQLNEAIPLKMNLFPYQANGVAYSLQKKKVIIGDQPGLGKTAQAIATILAADAFPCLVICPSSLKINWQREWHMWTDKKAMILNDNVKQNFHLFWSSGLTQVFIVNYESLKKYFVQSINKPENAKLRLNHIKFKEQFTGIFNSVIIDESHRCFPYDTEIMTNKGPVKIGEIVENNLNNLLVRSVDLSNKSVSLKEIKTLWKNETGFKQLFKVRHEKGEFTATENHKVFTSTGRYKEVSEIQSGDYLYLLRESVPNGKGREDNSEMLFKELCLENSECKAGNQSSASSENDQRESRKNLRLVWRHILCTAIKQKQVLRKELFGKMEGKATGNDNTIQIRIKGREKQNSCYCTNAKSGTQKNAIRQNENKQSYSHARSFGKDFSKTQRSSVPIQRRKRANNSTAVETLAGIEFTGISTRISNYNRFSKRPVSKCSTLLQIRHRHTGNKAINRSRWPFSHNFEDQNNRSIQNGSLELVRVESCEVYQSTNFDRLTSGTGRIETVYDLEISDNHNYFANGILVSNCKSLATQQTKFTKGICTGKEYILALTGTPVINKPKDLISQLGIIEQMQAFGGYKNFVQRYCSGPNEASNLRELNYKLNLNCFYRRDKQDVLKDLPAKMRQVALCDISTRKEYADAEASLVQYLIKYKDADDEKIARALRGEIMVMIGILKNISARGKLKDVFEFVDDILESGEKLVIFAHLKEVISAIHQQYPKAVTITGSDSASERQHAVDSFQKNPDTKLIICSIKAAGVGLTLTASSRVAFVELPWTAADCDQCEDRCHRIGQLDSVTCTYFLGQNTIDEKIYRIIQTKREIASTVTGATEQVEENIVDLVADLFNQPQLVEA